MKARVKGTGTIVEVVANGNYYDTTDNKERYYSHELDFSDTTDYWTRLEDQYAGMAMQGMLSNEYTHKLYLDNENYPIGLLNDSITIAHALVEKLKEKEERK